MVVRTIQVKPNTPQRIFDDSWIVKENRLFSKRLAYTIKNDDTSNCFHGHDNQVNTTGFYQGTIISGGGGNLEERWHKGEVWVIASTTINITIEEAIAPLFVKIGEGIEGD